MTQSIIPNSTEKALSLSDDMLLGIMEQRWQQAMNESPALQEYIDAADVYVCSRAELLDAIRLALDAGQDAAALALHQLFMFRLTMSQTSGFNF